jgi:hypothetical protein
MVTIEMMLLFSLQMISNCLKTTKLFLMQYRSHKIAFSLNKIKLVTITTTNKIPMHDVRQVTALMCIRQHRTYTLEGI